PAGGGRRRLGLALARLGAALGRPAGKPAAVPRGKLASLEDHARYATAVFDKARELRDRALAGLSAADRAFLFSWAPELVRHYGPQLSCNDQTKKLLMNDPASCALPHERFACAAFTGATRTL